MEYYEVLSRRRMHRAFLPDPVPEESIQRIARSIRRAPSGGYSQGQSVVVVTDEAMRHTIAERFDEKSWVEEGSAPFVSTAPVHLVPCICERLYHERYNQPDKLAITGGEETTWPVPYWFVDAGAALMLVLMTAIARDSWPRSSGTRTRKQSCANCSIFRRMSCRSGSWSSVTQPRTPPPNGRRARSRSGAVRTRRSSTASAGAPNESHAGGRGFESCR